MARMSASDRRTALLDAALTVIAERGVSAATTRAIVAEAGMSLASFHYAFRSRDEMMRELITLVLANQSTAVFAILEEAADVRGAIRGGLQAFFDTVRADPGREQVMFELMQFALRTPGLEDLPAEQYRAYHDAVTELLEAGGRSTGVTWSIPVRDVARLVVTMTDGLTLAWLADRDDDAAARVLDFAADSLSALAVAIPAESDTKRAHVDH